MTADLDLDSVTKTDADGKFSISGSLFDNLAAGQSQQLTLNVVADQVGSYSASFDFNLSDEDLPGATSQTITLTATMNVVAGVILADTLTVDRGNQTGGTLADTFESDDSYVSFLPGLTLNEEEAPVRLVFDGTLPSDSPYTLDLVVESSAVTGGVFSTTMEAWNRILIPTISSMRHLPASVAIRILRLN